LRCEKSENVKKPDRARAFPVEFRWV
jgi:hypothetical protein